MISCGSKHENELVREIRLIEFQRSSGPKIFENFISDENIYVRRITADAIAKIGSPENLPALRILLDDKDSSVVKKTIFALGQIGEQDSLLLSLLNDERFYPFKKDIISALGFSKSDDVLTTLLNGLESFPDSLKIAALQSITFITPKNYKNNKIKDYLFHSNTNLSGTAAYFYSRHPHASAISSLIGANIQPASVWDKYRLKALEQSISKYYIQSGDSALIDSLKFRIITDLNNRSGSWQHRLYELSILRHYQDSISYKVIGKYLTDSNPHLRLSAINAIVKFDTIDAKPILLQVYQDAEWSDKGHIILAIAKDNPEMTYNLIQQNLDKGNTYFKQLLLKSLALIRTNFSIRQLHQFLMVPNIRLRMTAFEELLKLGYIGYQQTKESLLSGDLALTTIAAQAIIDHPEWAQYDDLSAAYAQYTEPQGIEALIALLNAIDLISSEESLKFIQEVYKNTSSFVIAKKARSSLEKANVSLSARTEPTLKLFVPENLILQKQSIMATIETNKGEIKLELYPEIAPATVSNFVDLANKGYYNNLLFHRVLPDFVIQGGDPRGDGWGGPGYAIPCEYNELPFERGTIGMATSGKDTGGSQFFICHSEQPHLNHRYTVFGKVITGMDVVDNIVIEDKIIHIAIEK